MRRPLTTTVAIVLLTATPLSAHRVDEYLQATTILVGRDRVQAEMRLSPGIAVVRSVLAAIDTDADGAISSAEERAYAERVLRDVSLTIDGDQLSLRLVSWTFTSVNEMRRGLGEIQLAFEADLPAGGHNRRVMFRNHHQDRIAAYLVNSLSPQDTVIRITAQNRDYRQSVYELSYTRGAAGGPSVSVDALLRWGLLLGGAVIVLLGRLAALWRRLVSTRSRRVLAAR